MDFPLIDACSLNFRAVALGKYIHILEPPIYIGLSANKNVSNLAKKRWHTYLKEENHRKTFVSKGRYLVPVMLTVIKLIVAILEKIRINHNHVVEKIRVE
ncbi:MAG TPA: hypothetical protein VE619_01820 [Nitrososphaeraceae archaeon]|nr:hypothetical protein [Nitrososphaeraceae archaeon]